MVRFLATLYIQGVYNTGTKISCIVQCIPYMTDNVYLQAYCPPASVHFAEKDFLAYDGLKSNDIRWNFEKFLIDSRGVPVIHYSEFYMPHDIEADISDMLMASSLLK